MPYLVDLFEPHIVIEQSLLGLHCTRESQAAVQLRGTHNLQTSYR